MNDLLGDEIPVAAKRNQSSESLEDVLSILTDSGIVVEIAKYSPLAQPWEVTAGIDGTWLFLGRADTCIEATRKVICTAYKMGYIKWYPE